MYQFYILSAIGKSDVSSRYIYKAITGKYIYIFFEGGGLS